MRVLHVSTFSPTQCGIATYTEELINHLPETRSLKLRMAYPMDAPCEGLFGSLLIQERKAYGETARAINRSEIDLVSLQHEFGIYGGTDGEFVMDLVRDIRKPVVTSLHTTSPRLPLPRQ